MVLDFDVRGMSSMRDYLKGFANLDDKYTVWVGSTVRYAAIVEFALGNFPKGKSRSVRDAINKVQRQVDIGRFDAVLESPGDDSVLQGLMLIAVELEREIKYDIPVDTGNLRASYATGVSLPKMRSNSNTNKLF